MEVKCLALKDLTSPRKGFSVVDQMEDGGHSDHKENIYSERRKSTPLTSAESIIPAFLMNRKGSTPDAAHITPIKHTCATEPWTPTANLKMLISAASPDIRDREIKKVLFRPIENNKDNPASPENVMEDADAEDHCQSEAADEEEAEKKPSRKQKSLGLLCQKFLALYPDYPPLHIPIWISLDEVATSLGVERRRIYDIVNVLESLMIVGRMAKNSYIWHGRQRLEARLQELQRRGREEGYHRLMELAQFSIRPTALVHEDDSGEGDTGNGGGNRKDKSLRIMSQKFVMLFLVSKTQTVTLDAAAKILIEESQDSSSHSKYKTKVRRLYDIANVLTSLGLIKKVHVREERGRKPAFKWLGPVEFSTSGNAESTLNVADISASDPTQAADRQLPKKKMPRHASFNILPKCPPVIQRQVNSAPCSPRQEMSGMTIQPVDYSMKTQSNKAVFCLQLGNSASISSQPHQNSIIPSNSSSVPSSNHPAPLTPHLYTPAPASHCLAYMPSFSQPSVVMLYRAPDKPSESPDGRASPSTESVELRKRRMEDDDQEERLLAKKGNCGLEESDEVRARAQREANQATETSLPHGLAGVPTEQQATSPSKQAQPTQYLYVPNSAGLDNFNFLLSASHPAAGSALPLALPYVLVPSSALHHYPLAGSDAHTKLSLNLMVGAGPYSLPSYLSSSPVPLPSSPEKLYRPAGGIPPSPCALQHKVCMSTAEPLTPLTPKESPASSKAFFQTPRSLAGAAPVARKRGSAQRRLDISHPLPS
ncbi:transcription factor E2F7 [Gouania willdenowi]|uniref:Transcription factor E2F7 n=1 Tax=Gouania willdenowi TaxID=441366 RepID=A0A8C5DZC5_GOUWI|nr:transcription factor E2F7 [Gouania willdenowi]